MKYVAAYALLTLGGNNTPSEADVKALIESVNGTVDGAKLSAFHSNIKGKNLDEVIKAGLSKVGTIGGSAPAAAAAPAAASKAPEAKKEEPKKEEPKEEEFEGAGDLFDF